MTKLLHQIIPVLINQILKSIIMKIQEKCNFVHKRGYRTIGGLQIGTKSIRFDSFSLPDKHE